MAPCMMSLFNCLLLYCTITTSYKCPKGVAASGKIQIINYVDPEDDSELWGAPTISKNITPDTPETAHKIQNIFHLFFIAYATAFL